MGWVLRGRSGVSVECRFEHLLIRVGWRCHVGQRREMVKRFRNVSTLDHRCVGTNDERGCEIPRPNDPIEVAIAIDRRQPGAEGVVVKQGHSFRPELSREIRNAFRGLCRHWCGERV
jgi:hypothetical protein